MSRSVVPAISRAARLLAVLAAFSLLLSWLAPSTAEAAGRGTRSDPYWTGTAFNTGDWRVTLGSTDTDVWDVVDAENMFNSPPGSGSRYVMVPVSVVNRGAAHAKPAYEVRVEFLGGNGRVYSDDCGVLPDDFLFVDDLYPGAKATGNVCAEVPSSAISGGQWRVRASYPADWRYVRLSNPAKAKFTSQPGSKTAFADSSVTFSAKVTGAQSLRWQQKVDGTWRDIKGATSSSHKVKAYRSYNGRYFRLLAKNSAGTSYSKSVKLTVKTKPDITAQPKSTGVSDGATAKFTVKTSGATRWQWQYQSGSTWKNISKATGKTYSVKGTKSLNGRKYRVVGYAKYGFTISKIATLTVEAKPTITTQPKSVQVGEGTTAKFSVKSSGATKWQWQYRSGSTWKNISKATGTSYSVTAASSINGRQYRVVASARYSSVTSKTAQLTVAAALPLISTQPSSLDVQQGYGGSHQLRVEAARATAYRWQVRADDGWQDIAWETEEAMEVPTDAEARYRVVVSNSAGSVTSREVEVRVIGTMERPIEVDQSFLFEDGSAVFSGTDPDAARSREGRGSWGMEVQPGFRLVEGVGTFTDGYWDAQLSLVARNGVEYAYYTSWDHDRQLQCGSDYDDADQSWGSYAPVRFCLPVDDDVDLTGALWRLGGQYGDVWIRTGL